MSLHFVFELIDVVSVYEAVRFGIVFIQRISDFARPFTFKLNKSTELSIFFVIFSSFVD